MKSYFNKFSEHSPGRLPQVKNIKLNKLYKKRNDYFYWLIKCSIYP